jgi:hypothetical protein
MRHLSLTLASPFANRWQDTLTFRRHGFQFESIVEIGIPAADECPCARKKVGGQEERSPPFVLTHVYALVGARQFQHAGVPSKYYMSERHGIRASSQRRQGRERSLEQRAVRLDNTIDKRQTSTAQQCERDDEAEEGRRARPEVAEKLGHQLIMGEVV